VGQYRDIPHPEGAHDLGQTQLRIREAQARTGQKRKKEEKLQRKMQNKQAKAGEGAESAQPSESDTPPA